MIKKLVFLICSVLIAQSAFSAVYLKSPLQDHITSVPTPTFRWKVTSPTAKYTLCFDTDNNPFDGGSSVDVTGKLSYTPIAGFSVAVPYYWGIKQVIGVDTLYSVVRRFYCVKPNHGGFFSLKDTAMHSFAHASDFPINICRADIDGDGLEDVISTDWNTDAVFWSRSIATGVMGENIFLSKNILSPEGLFAEDLDGDCDIDIVVSSYNGNKIVLFTNDGTGNFDAGVTICNESKIFKIIAADVNGDGDMDIVAIGDSNISLFTLINTAKIVTVGGISTVKRSFTKTIIDSRSNVSPSVVVSADFFGNGYPDLLVAYSDISSLVLYKNSGGSFDKGITLTDTVISPGHLDVCDIDRDGDYDFFLSTNANSNNSLVWYENKGAAMFAVHNITPPADFSFFASEIKHSDIDGNGTEDIVAIMSQIIFWFPNDGKGNFSEIQYATFALGSSLPLCIMDVDRNGVADIVSGCNDKNRLEWFRNIDGFPDTTEIGIAECSSSTSSVVLFGGINYLNNETILEKGFCWGTDSVPTVENSTVEQYTFSKHETGEISVILKDLLECQKYFTRIYIKTAFGVRYSTVREFRLKDSHWPSISWDTANPTILVTYGQKEAVLPDYTGLATISDNCELDLLKVTQLPKPGSLVKGPKVSVSLKVVDLGGNASTVYFDAVFKVMDVQEIYLDSGYNLVSIYIEPKETSLPDIFTNALSIKTLDGFYNNTMPMFLNSAYTTNHSVVLVQSPKSEWVSVYGFFKTAYQIQYFKKGWNAIGVPYYGVPLPLSKLPAETEQIKDISEFFTPATGQGTLERLMPGNGYFIKFSDDCQIDWSLYANNYPPQTPMDMKPINGAALKTTDATLIWTSEDYQSDEIWFTILLGTDPEPSKSIITNLSAKTYTVSGLTPNTVYYWKVIVYDSWGHFMKSSVQHFTTGN